MAREVQIRAAVGPMGIQGEHILEKILEILEFHIGPWNP